MRNSLQQSCLLRNTAFVSVSLTLSSAQLVLHVRTRRLNSIPAIILQRDVNLNRNVYYLNWASVNEGECLQYLQKPDSYMNKYTQWIQDKKFRSLTLHFPLKVPAFSASALSECDGSIHRGNQQVLAAEQIVTDLESYKSLRKMTGVRHHPIAHRAQCVLVCPFSTFSSLTRF